MGHFPEANSRRDHTELHDHGRLIGLFHIFEVCLTPTTQTNCSLVHRLCMRAVAFLLGSLKMSDNRRNIHYFHVALSFNLVRGKGSLSLPDVNIENILVSITKSS